MVNTRKTSLLKEVISPNQSTDWRGRAPAYVWFFHNHKWKQRYDPSAKQQAPRSKDQAPSFKRQALQASSDKRQALRYKPQASSHKQQAP